MREERRSNTTTTCASYNCCATKHGQSMPTIPAESDHSTQVEGMCMSFLYTVDTKDTQTFHRSNSDITVP